VSHPLRRGLRRIRRWLALSVAILLILLAVLVALTSQLLPVLERHPEDVAAWLEQRIGHPVSLSMVSARWSRRGPVLDISDLRIGREQGVDIGAARVRVNVYSGLLPGQPLLGLRVQGPRVELARSVEGRWQVRGFYGGRGVDLEQALAQIERVGEIELFDGELLLQDEASGLDLRFERIDARLRTLGGRFRFALRVHTEGSPPLTLIGDVDTALQAGQIYLGARQLDLPAWTQGAQLDGLTVDDGRADLDLWLQLAGGRAQQVDSRLQIEGAALGRSSDGAVARSVRLDDLDLQFQLQSESAADQAGTVSTGLEAGWLLRLPQLRLQAELPEPAAEDAQAGRGDAVAQPQREAAASIDGLALRWRPGQWGLQAESLQIDEVAKLLPTLLPVAPELGQWLQSARPKGRVESLAASFANGELQGLQAQLRGLALEPVGARPGFAGLDLDLSGGADSLTLTLDAPQFSLLAPESLIAPLPAALSGPLQVWREEGRLNLEANALRVQGPDFAATVEGRAWDDGEGRKPSLDLRAVVDPGSISAAHRFWVRNKMSPKAVEWLERAIVDGRLEEGVALFRGDLDDWPFDGKEGVFEAHARVADVVFDYFPGWPTATQLAGEVHFLNNSLDGTVTARVLGVDVERGHGVIENFRQPVLQLELAGGGSGGRLLTLLRESPLWDRFGRHMAGLSIGGSAQVRVDIEAPLKKELGELSLEGSADLAEADLVDSQWGLRFAGASGRLRFAEDGFSADELGVRFDGQPGSLSLAAGSFCSDPAHVFEASLGGDFAVDSLLALRPELHWLEPYLQGDADWSIDFAVPTDVGADRLSQLRVRTDLRGIEVRLPAPLRKSAQGMLPLDLRLPLPATEAPFDLRLGRLLRLRAQPGEDVADFRGIAAFGASGGEATGELPERGLRVLGSAPIVDAMGWATLVFAGTGGAGLEIAGIDVEAGRLNIGERGLADQRLAYQRDPEGRHQLRLDGEGAEGRVEWSGALADPVRAQFARIHWPPGPEPEPGTPPPPPRRVAEPDPTLLPPFELEIEDARFGKASLGRIELKTTRGADGQLVEYLRTRSKDLEVDIRGDWSRSLAGSESRFVIGFSGEDLGRMLEALGIAPLVQGGRTRADMDLRWDGGPANFAFAWADGQLRLEVGKGRVPELEPGAGRFLGLLSLAEIPRRLSLDFSDFFRSGLAFNSIEGTFELAEGSAVTDDLRIVGPAAEIGLRGRTGLAEREYDLRVEVLPRTGSVLPALGALTAGPAGAAVGAVAQAVLQSPMKQMNRTLYSVTGSWDEPSIDVLEKGPARTEPARRGPRGGGAQSAPVEQNEPGEQPAPIEQLAPTEQRGPIEPPDAEPELPTQGAAPAEADERNELPAANPEAEGAA
jgi:uncharacterized protein (TIGR02099 family)